MTTNAPGPVTAQIEARRDAIFAAWLRTVTTVARGRMTAAESEHELRPMFDSLLRGVRSGSLVAGDPVYDELRAMLAEYSRTRARQGFTPTETAAAVFALRQAVLDALVSFDDFPAFSQFVDDLGLLTFET